MAKAAFERLGYLQPYSNSLEHRGREQSASKQPQRSHRCSQIIKKKVMPQQVSHQSNNRLIEGIHQVQEKAKPLTWQQRSNILRDLRKADERPWQLELRQRQEVQETIERRIQEGEYQQDLERSRRDWDEELESRRATYWFWLVGNQSFCSAMRT